MIKPNLFYKQCHFLQESPGILPNCYNFVVVPIRKTWQRQSAHKIRTKVWAQGESCSVRYNFEI